MSNKRIRKAAVKDLVPLVVEAWDTNYGSVKTKLSKSERKVALAEDEAKYVRLATGGWSANEEVIETFFQNPLHSLCWRLSAAGGLYILRKWE